MKFLEREAGTKGPFFLYAAYTLPHAKFQIPELEPYTRETNWSRKEKVYASMLTRIDRDVGRMLSILKAADIEDETLAFFCSDNGAANRYEGVFDSSGPLRGNKGDLYDGGIRTVMVARWPRVIKAGGVSSDIWYFPDVLPTLAELAGVAPPEEIDGVSVLPSLVSGSQPELRKRPLYWESGSKQAARMANWKAVRPAPDEPLELYDLAQDIGEQNDIAADHPVVAAWFKRYLAEARTPSPHWPSPLDSIASH